MSEGLSGFLLFFLVVAAEVKVPRHDAGQSLSAPVLLIESSLPVNEDYHGWRVRAACYQMRGNSRHSRQNLYLRF